MRTSQSTLRQQTEPRTGTSRSAEPEYDLERRVRPTYSAIRMKAYQRCCQHSRRGAMPEAVSMSVLQHVQFRAVWKVSMPQQAAATCAVSMRAEQLSGRQLRRSPGALPDGRAQRSRIAGASCSAFKSERDTVATPTRTRHGVLRHTCTHCNDLQSVTVKPVWLSTTVHLELQPRQATKYEHAQHAQKAQPCTFDIQPGAHNNLRERATLELQRARCTVSRQVCRNAMCASTGTRGSVWHALRLSVAVCCPGGAAHLEHPSASTPVSWTMRRIQRSSGSNARTCTHPMMLAAVPKALQALSACDSSFFPPSSAVATAAWMPARRLHERPCDADLLF